MKQEKTLYLLQREITSQKLIYIADVDIQPNYLFIYRLLSVASKQRLGLNRSRI